MSEINEKRRQELEKAHAALVQLGFVPTCWERKGMYVEEVYTSSPKFELRDLEGDAVDIRSSVENLPGAVARMAAAQRELALR